MASSSRLGPGEKGKIRVSIDIRGKLGTIYKTVQVRTNDPKAPQTTIAVRMTIRDATHMKTYSASEIFNDGCKKCHVLQGKGKTGFDLFVSDCMMCHSAGKIASPMRDLHTRDREYIEKAIREGLKQTSMPGWDAKHAGPLTEEEIMSLVDFLKPLPR
jgi:cytochrome c5